MTLIRGYSTADMIEKKKKHFERSYSDIRVKTDRVLYARYRNIYVRLRMEIRLD